QGLASGPVDDGYMLGAGDVLAVILTGATETAFTTEVGRDGSVVLPQAGRMSVANLTLAQARQLFFDRLRAVYATLGRGADARTQLAVTVSQVRTLAIRVVGEVGRPGTYLVTATGGALAALYEAAGPSERGNWRAVEVRRGNELIGTLDLYDYLLTGALSRNVSLATGDVIFVPGAGPRVRVAGAVRRPAIYELRPGEGVREAVAYAGGPRADASLEAATLVRMLASDQRRAGFARTIETVILGQALAPVAPGVMMSDGDSLMVYEVTGGRRLGVTVAGSVWQPGTYQLTDGMRLWDALQAAGGLRPETYRGRVQVLRTMPDSTRRMFGVALPAEGAGPPSENPPLMERDSIVVHARTSFRPRRWVAVGGAVQ
ncbi:MAG: SLBB domain-containing protein, partial [Gemmatimonadales bacterium]